MTYSKLDKFLYRDVVWHIVQSIQSFVGWFLCSFCLSPYTTWTPTALSWNVENPYTYLFELFLHDTVRQTISNLLIKNSKYGCVRSSGSHLDFHRTTRLARYCWCRSRCRPLRRLFCSFPPWSTRRSSSTGSTSSTRSAAPSILMWVVQHMQIFILTWFIDISVTASPRTHLLRRRGGLCYLLSPLYNCCRWGFRGRSSCTKIFSSAASLCLADGGFAFTAVQWAWISLGNHSNILIKLMFLRLRVQPCFEERGLEREVGIAIGAEP
jgi:hypothetical protein